MESINPLILDGLKRYLEDNPSIPHEMEDLVMKLLQVQTFDRRSVSGIDKIYDQILEKFINNDKLVEWSKSYVNR